MAVVVLTNSTTGADDIGFHLMDETIPLKKIRKPVPVPVPVLQTYVGIYELTPAFKIDVTLNESQLSIQATGQSKVDVFAESESKFYLTVVDAQVEFFKNESGSIAKLVLYQGGMAQNAVKIK